MSNEQLILKQQSEILDILKSESESKRKYRNLRPNFTQFKYINAAEAAILLDLKPSERNEHVIKLLNACGVEPHPIQHLSQGAGLKLQYKKEEVLEKCIVQLDQYVKKNIKT